ncbi:MAG: archaetidylserine decarboxylase [Burkholderiales bacterium]
MTAIANALREDLNFLVTNRLPRNAATRFMRWFSRIEQPLVRDASIAIWRRFADLELHEAAKARFTSLHDCFTRTLKEGARTVDRDPSTIVSPCDGIVGAGGRIAGTRVLQAKGMPYTLEELLGDAQLAASMADGAYVTLRLTASMYHRFHAPDACTVRRVTYVSGDTWNVNPIALARIERLFCRNERAIVHLELQGDPPCRLLLVAVGAILVGSVRLHCLPDVAAHAPGVRHHDCHARYERGDELGWFEHGSTIIVIAPASVRLAESASKGHTVRMGEPLLHSPVARRHAQVAKASRP